MTDPSLLPLAAPPTPGPTDLHVVPRAPGSPLSDARQTAEKLEASFLAEMLKSAGFGAQEGGFGGGIGEDQFASFQRNALAAEMARTGGIGLANDIFQSLLEHSNDR